MADCGVVQGTETLTGLRSHGRGSGCLSTAPCPSRVLAGLFLASLASKALFHSWWQSTDSVLQHLSSAGLGLETRLWALFSAPGAFSTQGTACGKASPAGPSQSAGAWLCRVIRAETRVSSTLQKSSRHVRSPPPNQLQTGDSPTSRPRLGRAGHGTEQEDRAPSLCPSLTSTSPKSTAVMADH